ncbi:MAG: prenyltransferase [Haloarculaceae archaeon]
MTLRDLLVRSRPRFWFYLAGPVLVGVAFGARSVADLFAVPALALFAYFLVPANVFLYGVNDTFDADTDRYNPKKEGREARYGGERATPLAALAGGLLGVALLAVLPRAAWPWVVGFLVLGAAYSVPPARLKARPPLDSLSNGLYVLPGAAAYAAFTGGGPPVLALAGAWLWAMGMHTFSAIPDIAPDRRAGVETLATTLGHRGALVYCGGCWTLSAAVFAVLDPRAGLLLLVYPLLALVVHVGPAVERAYWWFPAINTAVGACFTLAGLWGVVYG